MFIKCPCTWDIYRSLLRPWIPKHVWAKFNRGKSVQVQAQVLRIPNQWGDHSHGTHRLPHFWPVILTPYISQTPQFLPKIVLQSPIFSTLSKILETFTLKDPKSVGIWKKKKKHPNAPYFYGFCHWKTPLFFALHACVWGECCSLKHGQ